MLKKALWLAILGIGAPAVMIWSIVLLTYTSTLSPPTAPAVVSNSVQYSTVLSANDSTLPEYSSEIGSTDARSAILTAYLSRYGSELAPFSPLIVETSDKYGLDFRLLVAIAQQESNLCKKIPANSHNCWGFGIYGDKVTRFDSYPQAFEIIAKTLKTEYVDKGLNTPEKIMAKYTPPSLELGGPWAKGVNTFLADME